MLPKQPSEVGLGRISYLFGRVLVVLAVLWLVQAPVQHALAHASSDSDHGSSDDPTACLVCRVIAANPQLDAEAPPSMFTPIPVTESDEVVLPDAPLVQTDVHPTDFARGPPMVARYHFVSTGRLRPT
jgi:hypothetical protein